MGRNPYRIEGPAIISFSGGRSSGFMLWNILQAHGGTLSDDVLVSFQNTGKEMPQTLDFIRDCQDHWGVDITWLEWRKLPEFKTKGTFEIVTWETASRNGEPFMALCDSAGALPNPVHRMCTAELKIKTQQKWVVSLGFDEWDSVIGLRSDEPRRVANMRSNKDKRAGLRDFIMPMADAGVTKKDVAKFWRTQNFDLNLPNINGTTPAGNCDLCFLKSAKTIMGLMRDDPGLADWWIKAEAHAHAHASKPSGAVFRVDRPSYSQMADIVERQGDFFHQLSDTEPTLPCMCHD